MENILNTKVEKKEFYKSVMALVLPMAIQNLINFGVNAVDVIMLGKVGEIALSASSLAGQVYFVLTLFAFGISSGAAVLAAQYWGKKDTETIEKILGYSLRLGVAISVLFTVAAQFFPEALMKIFTSEAAVIQEGAAYLRIISVSYIVSVFTMTYLNIIRSAEKVVVSMVIYFISLVINVILNAIFIFGLLGSPALGVKGAAIATTIARFTEVVLVIIYIAKINKTVLFKFKDFFVKDKVLARNFYKYSVPVIINEVIWGLGVSAISAVLGHLGSSAVAANSVVQVVRQIAMVVVFGISNATAIMIGKVIGQGKKDYAKVYAKRFQILALSFGAVGAVLILLISPLIRQFMTLGPEASGYLRDMLFVLCYFIVAQAFNTVTIVGIFRGGGDTKVGLVIDVTTLWGCAILFGALAAFVFDAPVIVVFMLLTSDEIIKIPMCIVRYKSYKWLNDVTR